MGIISRLLSPWRGPLHPCALGSFPAPALTSSLSLCSGKQLEEASGTWAGSSLRRTFSFLFGMTGRDKDKDKDKVGVGLGNRRRAAALPFLPVHPSPTLPLETQRALIVREHMMYLQSSECPSKSASLCPPPLQLSRQLLQTAGREKGAGAGKQPGLGLPHFRPPIAKRWATEILPIGHKDDNYSSDFYLFTGC